MTMTKDLWREVEWEARQQAYRTLDNDPQILLETDSGGPSVQAEVIMARLIGYEDEIVEDGLRLTRVEPVIRMPIMRRPWIYEETQPPPDMTMPAAEYRVQSGFALVHLDAMYAPPDVEFRPPTFTFRVLYLRYRRRA